MTQNGAISARQKKLIGALLTHATITAACAAAGVGRSTLRRWLTNPVFVSELHYQEQELLQAVSRALLTQAEGANAALSEILTDKANPPGARLRAAEIILSNLLRIRELADHEQRLTALENARNG